MKFISLAQIEFSLLKIIFIFYQELDISSSSPPPIENHVHYTNFTITVEIKLVEIIADI